MARASPRAGALEGRCTHVKLRTPLFRRPHAAEKLSQPSRIPPRRFRRRGRDGRRSPERLRRCPRDGPVRRRRRHLRDDARGGVRRHRRRIEPAAVPARRARTDDPSRARAVLVSRPHRPPDFCRGSWGPRGGNPIAVAGHLHVQRLERGFRRGGMRVRRHVSSTPIRPSDKPPPLERAGRMRIQVGNQSQARW